LVSAACPALTNEAADWTAGLGQSRGGTLLLDVVSDLSLVDQDALLRAIRAEARGASASGGDVRLRATTPLDLETLPDLVEAERAVAWRGDLPAWHPVPAPR
jgi:DNA-binding NtrC family response regulator